MFMSEINDNTEARNYEFNNAQYILTIYNLFAQAKRHTSNLVKLGADLSSLVFTKKKLNYKSQVSFEKLRQTALRLLATMVKCSEPTTKSPEMGKNNGSPGDGQINTC